MFFFLLFGRGLGPRPNSKKKNAPAQTAKKITPEKPKQQKRPDNKKQTLLPLSDLAGWQIPREAPLHFVCRQKPPSQSAEARQEDRQPQGPSINFSMGPMSTTVQFSNQEQLDQHAYGILHQAHLASMQFAMLASQQMSAGVHIQMASQYQRSLTAGSMHGPQSVGHRPTVSSMLRPQSPAITAGLEPRTTTMPGAFDSTNPASTDTVNATALVFQPCGAPAITALSGPLCGTVRYVATHCTTPQGCSGACRVLFRMRLSLQIGVLGSKSNLPSLETSTASANLQ